MGPTYNGASMVMAAIDGLGTLLAGEMEPFPLDGSVGPGRAEAVKVRQTEMSGNQEARPATIQRETP